MKKFVKIIFAIGFPPFGLFWLYKAKGIKVAAPVTLAIFALGLMAPSEEDRLQELADSKGITLEQLKHQITEEEALRKKYALPKNYSYASEEDETRHRDAVDNGLKIEFMQSQASDNFTSMISQVINQECSSTKFMYDTFDKQYSDAVTKWNRMPKHVKAAYDNDLMKEPTVDWAVTNLRQEGKKLSKCNLDAIRSRGYAFIYVK